MQFNIITIFPGLFTSIFDHGVVKRAIATGLVDIRTHDLRDFTHDRHRTVDDRPFGGGEGMVLKPEPISEALESLGIRPRTSPAKSDFKTSRAGSAFEGSDECQGTTSVVPNF